MSLTAADVAQIMRLVEESTFDELTLEVDGMKLCLRRGGAARTEVIQERAPAPAVTTPAQGIAATASVAKTAPLDPSIHEVASPLLGTFYRAPKPGSPSFVEVGSVVAADTVVGIVEVMKLMNAVRAGVHGTVTEILASDGGLVEYGEPLLRVRKAD